MLKEKLSFVLETIRYSPAVSRIRHRGLKISRFVPPVRSFRGGDSKSLGIFLWTVCSIFMVNARITWLPFVQNVRQSPPPLPSSLVIFAYSLTYPINSGKRTARISCSISHVDFIWFARLFFWVWHDSLGFVHRLFCLKDCLKENFTDAYVVDR